MEETASVNSASQAGTNVSAGTKRKRAAEPKFYAVRVGFRPGIYHTWADCLEQVKGFKKALCENCLKLPLSLSKPLLIFDAAVKSFASLTDAERFLAGENIQGGGSSSSNAGTKFYAVKNGRVPGIYTEWLSAQDQITGWQKPKHRSFSTRIEAQRWLDEGGIRSGDSPETTEVESTISVGQQQSEDIMNNSTKSPPPKKVRKTVNGTSKGAKIAPVEYNEAAYEPGTGPLPPGTEDGFDPNIMLDPVSGKVVYKTQEQRQATKPHPGGPAQSGALRIHTDGSALGNGQAGAFAGVGVYFGPGDKR